MTNEQKIANLRAALDLALKMLERFEPGDSRAVSDEFVAMASIASDCEDDDCMNIIRIASKREFPPIPAPEIEVAFQYSS